MRLRRRGRERDGAAGGGRARHLRQGAPRARLQGPRVCLQARARQRLRAQPALCADPRPHRLADRAGDGAQDPRADGAARLQRQVDGEGPRGVPHRRARPPREPAHHARVPGARQPDARVGHRRVDRARPSSTRVSARARSSPHAPTSSRRCDRGRGGTPSSTTRSLR